MTTLVGRVWGDDQVLCDAPDESIAVRVWAAVALELLGRRAVATVSIDCDDPDTEARLRVAGYQVAAIDPAEGPEVVESVTLERTGPLEDLLAPVLRLAPEAPLGALAIAGGAGADLDLGIGLDVWGDGAIAALRAACAGLSVDLIEREPDE